MIVGYGAIVGLTSLGFNGALGGRTLYGGPPLILAAGMLVAVIAGLGGGYIAVPTDCFFRTSLIEIGKTSSLSLRRNISFHSIPYFVLTLPAGELSRLS